MSVTDTGSSPKMSVTDTGSSPKNVRDRHRLLPQKLVVLLYMDSAPKINREKKFIFFNILVIIDVMPKKSRIEEEEE
jgi:hypothetical protein